ncbi:MAG: signal peptide peptidase SppA [Candidatus Delongbacteria bacterium]|nr:signal peptide peptidase SppA [Candidatus Delongbacteria bacterium]
MESLKRLLKWFLKTTFTVVIVFSVMFVFILLFISKITYDQMNDNINIKKDSYVVLAFPNGLKESPSNEFNLYSMRFKDLNKRELTFYEVLRSIDQAADDSKISGIILDLDSWNISSVHTKELSVAMEKFKESGKKIFAYSNGMNKNSYLAAIYADEIVMPPSNSSNLMLSGYSISVPYYKDLGTKLGINVNVIHIGDFKGSGENFARNSMSDNFRESITDLLDARLELFIDDVTSKRNIDKNTFTTQLLNGDLAFINPNEAIQFKLIDKTQSYDDFLGDKSIRKKQLVQINDYPPKENYTFSDSKIAVVFAEGTIDMGNGNVEYMDDTIYPEKFSKIFDKIEKDKDIKALVLRVNSPGGSALASELILQKIGDLKKRIPVIVSMGPVAASGGYYISSFADKIFLDKYSVTGSIGVVAIIPNFKEMVDKIGINYEKIEKGKYADLFNLTDSTSQEELALFKKVMTETYVEFKDRVSKGRNMDLDDLEKIAQGKIWTGEQAVANGLTDEIGGLQKAIEEAAVIARIKNYSVEMFPKSKSFTEKLFETEMETSVKIFDRIESKELKSSLRLLENSLKFSKRPVLLMPYSVE